MTPSSSVLMSSRPSTFTSPWLLVSDAIGFGYNRENTASKEHAAIFSEGRAQTGSNDGEREVREYIYIFFFGFVGFFFWVHSSTWCSVTWTTW